MSVRREERSRGGQGTAIPATPRQRGVPVHERTDAHGAVSGSLEEAIWRGRAHTDAGVDLVWCELSSASREPAVAFARALRDTRPAPPLAFNDSSSFTWNRDPDPFTFRERGALGYRFIFITLYAAHAGMHAAWNAREDLARNQEKAQWALEKLKEGHPEKAFIPGTEDRIEASARFADRRMH